VIRKVSFFELVRKVNPFGKKEGSKCLNSKVMRIKIRKQKHLIRREITQETISNVIRFGHSNSLEVIQLTGRNSKPDNDGPASKPGRLDQFGDKLSSHNEEEFSSAVEQACEAVENAEPDH
jgi:hypothetical protein